MTRLTANMQINVARLRRAPRQQRFAVSFCPALLLGSAFGEYEMQDKAVEKEQVERIWFLRVATVLMIGMIAVGAVPIIKNALFPVEKTNR
jgi:hypothetical protein